MVYEVGNSEVKVTYGSNPWRKSKTLSVQRGSVSHAVAYFRDEDAYLLFVDAMHELFGGDE